MWSENTKLLLSGHLLVGAIHPELPPKLLSRSLPPRRSCCRGDFGSHCRHAVHYLGFMMKPSQRWSDGNWGRENPTDVVGEVFSNEADAENGRSPPILPISKSLIVGVAWTATLVLSEWARSNHLSGYTSQNLDHLIWLFTGIEFASSDQIRVCTIFCLLEK